MTKPVYAICEQQRSRSACASRQFQVSNFVIHCLDRHLNVVVISKITSVAEQAGLSLTWSHNSAGMSSHDVGHLLI